MTSHYILRRFTTMGLALAVFGAVALGQTLSSFTCSPTSIIPGASTTCTVSLTAYNPTTTGLSVKLSTTATGLALPASIIVPWLRSSVSFTITTTTSTAPKAAVLVATLGTVSKSATVTITGSTIYTITSLACTPGKIIPGQTSSCLAYLSAEAPPGGLVATLTDNSANLSTPISVRIPATVDYFRFNATASNAVAALEKVTVTAVVSSNSGSATVTIDPTPKFYFKCNPSEVSVVADRAGVTPSVAPASWTGALGVRGAGYVALDPIVGDGGCSFHRNGAQNVDTSFVNFSAGTTFGQVFENSSEISFSLKSAYSLAERQALPAPNIRSAFEVYDDVGPMFNFSTSTLSNGALQFCFGARGYSAVYTVATGQEDALFGKGVALKIGIRWTFTTFSLYLNDVLVQTNSLSPRSTNWSSQSAFTIGSRSLRNAGGGYYASDDTIAEFVVR